MERTMIAHQRRIRDAHSGDGHPVPVDFSTATVREVSVDEAKAIILKYEWLGNMGQARRAFGLFFGDELAGVECFGVTAGSNTAVSVCGPEHADKVATLVRGACVHWAHPHSATYLITRACQTLSREGKHIFVAYSDEEAGEVGTVYQASNWLYCGTTNPKGSLLREHDGRSRDERCVSGFARARSTEKEFFFRKPTRKEIAERLKKCGFTFERRTLKHRYVGIYGNRATRRELCEVLRWPVLPYPKRSAS
jgi:hypothetical protein